MKKFSVITVCLNTEAVIAATIQSVLDQSFTDYEYIVKDGGSQDATVRIAESFGPAFAEKGIPYRVISAPDLGIYDAMNQALKEVQGQWIIFMNSGDQFAACNVLEMVSRSKSLDSADILYGDCVECRGEGYRYKKALPLEQIRERLPFSHQSAFAKIDLFKRGHFSTKYHICSDYELFLKWYLEKKSFVYLPFAISVFALGGTCSNSRIAYQESLRIHQELTPEAEDVIRYQRKMLTYYCRRQSKIWRFLSALIPKSIQSKRAETQRKCEGWKSKENVLAEAAEKCKQYSQEIDKKKRKHEPNP